MSISIQFIFYSYSRKWFWVFSSTAHIIHFINNFQIVINFDVNYANRDFAVKNPLFVFGTRFAHLCRRQEAFPPHAQLSESGSDLWKWHPAAKKNMQN